MAPSFWYHDPNATGDDDGIGNGADQSDPTDSANWVDAFTDIYSVQSVATAGDYVFTRNGQSMGAVDRQFTMQLNFVGCDGVNGFAGGVLSDFDMTSSIGGGFNFSANSTFLNIGFKNHAVVNDGPDFNNKCRLYNCRFLNMYYGARVTEQVRFVHCTFDDAVRGIFGNSRLVYVDKCLFRDMNTAIFNSNDNVTITNSVFDTCTVAVDHTNQQCDIDGNVFYNCGTGLELNGTVDFITIINNKFIDNTIAIKFTVLGYGYLLENNGFRGNGTKISDASGNEQLLLTYGNCDLAADGVESKATGNFTTTTDSELRRVEKALGYNNEVTKIYLSAGLIGPDPADGGGTKSRLGEIIGIKRGIGIL